MMANMPPNSIFLPYRNAGHGSATLDATQPRALIYFICGNPGLIEFYRDFLLTLQALLSQSSRQGKTAIDIYGRNLLGFSDEDHVPFSKQNLPWGLEGQIQAAYEDVMKQSEGVVDDQGSKRGYDHVILMGHSVGAYIATEITHRHMKSPKSRTLHLKHAILLFPTLTHIAKSSAGKRMVLLQSIPYLDANFHILARGLTSTLPFGLLQWFAHNVLGMTSDAATVVATWLKSRDGVWQAVHLGQDEMRQISDDVWAEELWEVVKDASDDSGKKKQTPKFFLFYAKNDHWVANTHRDEFIDRRKNSEGMRIVIDQGNIPHAFCTREKPSYDVAVRVCQWIDEIDGIVDY